MAVLIFVAMVIVAAVATVWRRQLSTMPHEPVEFLDPHPMDPPIFRE